MDYRDDIYRYREPEVPDGQEKQRAYLRCEQQARHVPSGWGDTYGALTRGSLEKALDFCESFRR